jgi:tRNA (cytidine/uridine-2'-O-)-methyltransferase
MRTAVAAGCFLHIIGPLPFSLQNKDLKRAGLDYIDDLKMRYYDSYEQFKEINDSPVINVITRYGNKPYSNGDFSQSANDYFFIFGRESTGIPLEIMKEHEPRWYRIPMKASSRSLNLSNCVAIVVYEVLRQQGFVDLATSEKIKSSSNIKK